ncbi:MAG TPA: hypothetical protein VKT22_02595 [Steroidobacteraceae bacterium]|nr:hypothetical protein [Steroidobacteraceae bacterium]
MNRGKVTIAAAAVFAIGVAFAAQTTPERPDRGVDQTRARLLWTPGTNGVAAAYESSREAFAPPL